MTNAKATRYDEATDTTTYYEPTPVLDAFEVKATSDFIVATAMTEDRASAAALAARFPKSLRMRATGGSGVISFSYRGRPAAGGSLPPLRDFLGGERRSWGYAEIRVHLKADGANHGVNEAGISRYRSFRRTCDKLGVTVQWGRPFSNSITEAELEAILGA